MKAIAVALVLLGFVVGCAGMQSTQSSTSSAPDDRPDLRYKTQSDCEKAGHTWRQSRPVPYPGECL
jgi:hypothetical protein